MSSTAFADLKVISLNSGNTRFRTEVSAHKLLYAKYHRDKFRVETLAGNDVLGDYRNGTGDLKKCIFYNISGIAVDKSGNVYVSDTGNHVIRVLNFENQTDEVFVGSPRRCGLKDGPSKHSLFHSPAGLCFSKDYKTLFICDTENACVRKANGYTVSTFVTLKEPWGICSDSMGRLYVTDQSNHVIYQVQTNGVATAILVGENSFIPYGIVLHPENGNQLFFTRSLCVEMYDISTKIRTRLAGSDKNCGYADLDGIHALFDFPMGLCYHEGHLLVSDARNNRIRQVHAESGAVKTLSGSGYSGVFDSTVMHTRYSSPSCIIKHPSKQCFYVADYKTIKIIYL